MFAFLFSDLHDAISQMFLFNTVIVNFAKTKQNLHWIKQAWTIIIHVKRNKQLKSTPCMQCLLSITTTTRVQVMNYVYTLFSTTKMRDGIAVKRLHLSTPKFSFIYRGHIAWRPPSTGTVAPVMKEAASDARNAMVDATSSGCPGRPSGCVSFECSRN